MSFRIARPGGIKKSAHELILSQSPGKIKKSVTPHPTPLNKGKKPATCLPSRKIVRKITA